MKQNKQFVFETKVLDEKNRIIEMVGSTENYDRVGDKMLMAGVTIANYLKNPIILPNHNYQSQAIGKTIDLKVVGSQLIFKIQFAETELGQEWFYLYANKFMNASSIGFDPLEYKPNDKGGYDFTKWDLLELSLVTVPCNPEAIQRAFKDGHISKSLFDDITNVEREVEEMKVEEIKALVDEATKKFSDEIDALKDSKTKSEEKIQELEDQITKSGASLSKSTVNVLTKVAEGLKEHSDIIVKLMQDCMNKDDDSDMEDMGKDYSEEDIKKLVEGNITKILEKVGK